METSAGSILLAEPFGGVAQSDDQGESWSFAQNQVPGEVSAIAETSDGSLLVASSRGLYRGTAGSWQRVRTGIVFDIFVSGDVVFSSGPGGGYRSEDGGQNWTKLAYSFSLFRSSGLSRLLPAAGDTLVGISRGDLVVSPDLGNTWIEGSGPGNGLWNLDLTPDASGGFLAATTEGIWRSESGTGNWTRFDSFADPMQFNTLELAGDRWIYALTSTGIARSLDAGANWEIHSFQDTGLSDVCGTNLSAAADGALYYGDHVSMDRGLTYVKIAGVVGESCYVVHAGGSGDVYLGTELGLMTAAGVAVAVEPSQLPEDTALMDAYPNPFRDELTVDVEGAVRVGLFDLLGREVKSVQAGSTSGRLDTSDLPAGVYFLRVETQTGVRAVPVTRVR